MTSWPTSRSSRDGPTTSSHVDEFIVILSGQVDVFIDGHVVATLGAGDHIGERALLDGSPRNASVVAKTDVRAPLVSLTQRLRQVELPG